MKKNIITLLIISVMFTLVTGCGKDNSSGTNTSISFLIKTNKE